MKYTIIFCLLLAFINTLIEFKPKFSVVNSLIRNIYDSNMKDSVCDADNKDKCKDLPNPEEDKICCYYENKVNDKIDEKGCRSYSKYIDIIGTKEYQAFIREYFAYIIYVIEEHPPKKQEQTLTCNNGVYSFEFGDDYSEKDIKDIKDENHCLNILYKKIDNYEFEVGECKDHLVLDSSKKAEVECGYFEYNIKLKSKGNVLYKTCNLFNLKYIQNFSKIDKYFKERDVKDIIKLMGISKDFYESFTVEAYNSKGHKIKYDSVTDKMIVEVSASKLTVLNYLFLLIILILF